MAFRLRPHTAQVQPWRCCSFIFLSTASFSILTSERRSGSFNASQKSRIFSRSPLSAKDEVEAVDPPWFVEAGGACAALAFASSAEAVRRVWSPRAAARLPLLLAEAVLDAGTGAAGGGGGLLMVLPVTDLAGADGTTGTADFVVTVGAARAFPLATLLRAGGANCCCAGCGACCCCW